jgi:hypothetical protein
MGQAVPIRTDYTAGEVRRFAKRAKDGRKREGFWRLRRCWTGFRVKKQRSSAGWIARRCVTGPHHQTRLFAQPEFQT